MRWAAATAARVVVHTVVPVGDFGVAGVDVGVGAVVVGVEGFGGCGFGVGASGRIAGFVGAAAEGRGIAAWGADVFEVGVGEGFAERVFFGRGDSESFGVKSGSGPTVGRIVA
jgi:hypothetical protein